MKRFLRRLRYTFDRSIHPYKIPALIFIVLATGMYLAYYITNCVKSGISYAGNPNNVVDVLLYALVCGFLLVFNFKDDSRAYNGLSLYIFMTIIDALFLAIAQGIFAFIGGMQASSPGFWISLLWLVILVATVVAGIYVYSLSRRYIRGYYRNWDAVRNWALLFTILVVVYQGLSVALFCLDFVSFSAAFVLILPSLANLCIAICCFFTLLRFKGF